MRATMVISNSMTLIMSGTLQWDQCEMRSEKRALEDGAIHKNIAVRQSMRQELPNARKSRASAAC